MTEGELPVLAGIEPEGKNQSWGYEARFKHYLYRLAILGNRGAESVSNFPERIELDDAWHLTLDRMRQASRDGFEYGVPVGYGEDRRKLLIPNEFIRGTRSEAFGATIDEAKTAFGIVHQAGFVHSHPGGWLDRIVAKTLISRGGEKAYEGYSPADLFRLLQANGLPMEVLVEKGLNYFAFRTQETKAISDDSPFSSRLAFERHWYRAYGARLINDQVMVVINPFFSLPKMNVGIARGFNLALYRGEPDKDLVRFHP
jgi:hypothetical protein